MNSTGDAKATLRARFRADFRAQQRRSAASPGSASVDLSSAPGLAAVLPKIGEWAAAFVSLPTEPPTSTLLQRLAADGLQIIVPAKVPTILPAKVPADRLASNCPASNCPAGRSAVASPDNRLVAADARWSAPAWSAVGPASCALPLRQVDGPTTQPAAVLPPETLRQCQLILVPALAVDRSGTRLGQGGGWYDRALNYADPQALILAVCFPQAVLAAGALPREAHDHPVDGVLTVEGVELFV